MTHTIEQLAVEAHKEMLEHCRHNKCNDMWLMFDNAKFIIQSAIEKAIAPYKEQFQVKSALYDGAIEAITKERQRAEASEKAGEEYKNCLAATELLRQGEKQRAESAEQLVAEMREALERLCVAACDCQTKTPDVKYHDHSCRYRIAAEALSLSAPTAGKWVPVNELACACGLIDRMKRFLSDEKSVRVQTNNLPSDIEFGTICAAMDSFLERHGDKPDNIEARRPPAHVDDGRIRPQRD